MRSELINIRKKINEVNKTLPDGLKLSVSFDRATYIKEAIKILSKVCKAAMLNFILAEYKDKKYKLYATKTAIKLTSPSLYYQINKNKSIYISSEKLDKKNWVSVKNNSLIECSKNTFKIMEIEKS